MTRKKQVLKGLGQIAVLLTACTLPAMGQTISSFNPPSVNANGPQFNLTINGTGFTGTNVLSWTDPGSEGAVSIPFTTSTSDSQIVVTIPAARIMTPGFANVAVCTGSIFNCGGTMSYEIDSNPVLTSLSQTSAIAGSGSFTLVLTGYNFSPTAQAVFGSQPALSGTVSGGTQLTVTVPASYLTNPGIVPVSVTDESTSNSINFTVGIQLTSVSGTPVLAGSGQNLTVTVTAVGGLGGITQFYWNGTTMLSQPGSPSATNAVVTIPAALTNSPNVSTITVVANGVTSNGLTFTSLGPTTTSISPTTATSGAGPVSLTVNGANFGVGSGGNAMVILTSPNGTFVLTPDTNNGSVITVTLPAADITTPGQATVAVQNYPSSGPISNTQTLTIYAVPVVTSASPTSIAFNTATALTLNGTFNTGDQINFNGTILATTGTTTQLHGTVPASVLQNIGPVSVRAVNPNNISSSTSATVNVIPVISSLNPNSVNAGSAAFLLTVNVTGGFGAGGAAAQVTFNGTAINATIVNANTVTATIPANLVMTAATVPVTVTFLESALTETSNPVNFTIGTPGPPTITNLTPNQATAGSPDTPVTITGTNFKSDGASTTGSRVLFTPPNGGTVVQLTPSSFAPTSLGVTIPQAQLTTAGVATIAVTNVTDGTTSGTLPFTIGTAPVITALAPNPTPAGGNVALTVTGSNFSSTDTIYLATPSCSSSSCATAVSTTYNSPTSLTANVLGSQIPLQGIYSIYDKVAGGGFSAAKSLTVGIQLTSLNPSTVTQNVTPVPTLVVQAIGGLTSTSVVYIAGKPLPTFLDSPTQVHATLSAANVATAGAYQVTVQMPGFGASNALPFTVTAAGTITAINPTSAFAGAAPTTITVSGTNFNNGDTVYFGTSPLATTFVNAQTLTALVPSALLANAGNFPVTVSNGSSSSNSINFAVKLEITGLSPTSVNAGGPAFNLTATLTGGVTSNTVLYYAGTLLQTVSTTATSVTALVPASLITAASTPPVYAVDGSNQSNTVNHLVMGQLTLISISPNSVDAGSNSLSLALTGVGFNGTSVVTVNGTAVPTSVTSNGLSAVVPASALTSPGTAQVAVVNGTQASNALPLTILTPLTLTSLNPSIVAAGSPQYTLTVNGTGFDMSTVITWTNGQTLTNLTTTFVSATQLTAIVPAALVTQVGSASVGATDSHSRQAAPLTETIASGVTITNLNPSQALVGTAVNLTITGTGFAPAFGVSNSGPVTVYFGTNAFTVTPVSPTEINLNIPAAANSPAGVNLVRVVTAGGLVSNSLPFTTVAGPIITSISPNGVTAGASGVVLTVSGSYFQPGSVIYVGGTPLVTTYVTQLQLTAMLPPFASSGTQNVQVVNPGGLVSNVVGLGVGNATRVPPQLTSISPSAVAAGSPGFTITAFGSGFQSGAVISFGGVSIPTSFVSTGQLNGVVSANLVAETGSIPVSVMNPDGSTTNALSLVVTGKPVIISLAPASVSAGAPTLSLGVYGLGFRPGAVVSFNGVALTTTVISATQLTASLPAGLLKVPGSFPVVVINLDSTASDPVPFTVNPFALVSINPAAANAGGAAFTLTLSGSGFLQGAVASFNGTTLRTTFVNATTLTANVPASLIATVGTAPVTVTNPDGAVAGPVNFTIQTALTLLSINPPTVPANSKATSITATGTGFIQGAVIVFNGAALATTYVNSTTLTGTIPATQLTQTGPVQVTVLNPNGVSSNAVTFTVGPPPPLPVITSVAPATALTGASATPITINGSGFVQGAVVQFAGAAVSTQFVGATQLTALLTATQLAQGGVFTIQVINPNGDQSNTVTFTVATPLSITSVSPASISQGAADTSITVTGVGIVSGATIQIGTASLAANVSGSTSASATIPAAQLTQAGP
ncbi:MAG TPA: IPT/TIG domain-containing protein, partial [Bryobacteraceae bacterium]